MSKFRHSVSKPEPVPACAGQAQPSLLFGETCHLDGYRFCTPLQPCLGQTNPLLFALVPIRAQVLKLQEQQATASSLCPGLRVCG